MASTYVNNLRLEEIATGEQSGTWGNTTNTNLEIIGQVTAWGTRAIANASTDNITLADGALDADRSLVLKLTGGGQACTVTLLPNTSSKTWVMYNTTSATLTFTCGSGANVAVLAGESKIIATDGLGSGGVVYDVLTGVNLAGTTKVDDLVVGDDATVTDDLIVGGDIDLEGSIDVNGTANLDVVDIDGAVQLDATLTVGANDQGYDVILYGDTAARNATWDSSADSLEFTDNTKETFGTGNDMQLYHDGTNSFITNSQGVLKLATETSGIALTLGHSTSEVTFGDNVTVIGNFAVNGTTTTINTTNLTVTDPLVKFGQGYTGTAYDQGFIVTRGNGSATNTANKGFIWDETADEFVAIACNTENGTTAGNVTINSYVDMQVAKLTGSSLDISGDIDVDGTTNLDIVDIDGAVNMAGTAVVIGVLSTTAATAFNGGFASNADSTMGTNKKIQFRDAAIHVSSSTDGQLDIVADTEIQIAATTIDINGAVDVSGDTTIAGDITSGKTVHVEGSTAAGDNAAIGYASGEGLILTGQGSSTDVVMKNDAGQSVLNIPTGTRNVVITAGNLDVQGQVDIGSDDYDTLINFGTTDNSRIITGGTNTATGYLAVAQWNGSGYVNTVSYSGSDNATTFAGEIEMNATNLTIDSPDHARLVIDPASASYVGNVKYSVAGTTKWEVGMPAASDPNYQIVNNRNSVTSFSINAVTDAATFAGTVTANNTITTIAPDTDHTSLEQVASSTTGAVRQLFKNSNNSKNFELSGFFSSGTEQLAIQSKTNTITRFFHDGSVLFEGNINAVAGGINLGATGSANLLDDYEIGSWTPTLVGADTAGTYTVVTGTSAAYTKVGRLVSVQARITLSAASGGGGTAIFGGLPFNYASGSLPLGQCATASVDLTNTNPPTISFQPTSSGAAATLVLAETRDNTSGQATPITGFSTSSSIYLNMTYRV